jgi:hypothetical protein
MPAVLILFLVIGAGLVVFAWTRSRAGRNPPGGSADPTVSGPPPGSPDAAPLAPPPPPATEPPPPPGAPDPPASPPPSPAAGSPSAGAPGAAIGAEEIQGGTSNSTVDQDSRPMPESAAPSTAGGDPEDLGSLLDAQRDEAPPGP